MSVRQLRRFAAPTLVLGLLLSAAGAPRNLQDGLREFTVLSAEVAADIRPSAWRRDTVIAAGVLVVVQSGVILFLVGVARRRRDALQRQEAEDTLEARLRQTAEALPIAVWIADADTGCSYVNEQWRQLTGRALDQEFGAGWLQNVHPDDRDACINAYQRAFDARQRFSIVYRFRCHDGAYRWLMDSGSPRYGARGGFRGYIGGCIDITERMEAEAALRDVNRRLLTAQEEERRRIARDLHDHVSQQLALLAIEIQQLALKPAESREALAQILDDAWRRASEIASDVHAIAYRLHPSKLEALGLIPTIRAHCRDLSRQGLAVRLVDRAQAIAVPADAALCLFRVLEEALSNVQKHSGTTEAEVSLEQSGDELVLRVVDAGAGFVTQEMRAPGLGLVSMRERLESLGGRLSIESAPGKGTAIVGRLPIRQPRARPAA